VNRNCLDDTPHIEKKEKRLIDLIDMKRIDA